jgi:hypothetical protein
MRKITLTLALALAFAGSAAFTADAQTSRGANNIGSAAQNFTPVEPAACRGWGPYCLPGFTRVCGRWALLVPSLLVIDKREAAAPAASFPTSSPVMIRHHLA